MLFLGRVLDQDPGVRGHRGVLRTRQRGVPSTFRVRSLRMTGGVGLPLGWRCWLMAFVSSAGAALAAMTGLSMTAVRPEVHERHPSKTKNQHPVACEEIRHLSHLFPCRCPAVSGLPKRSEIWCLQACRADVSVGPREHRETMKKPAEHRLAVGQSAVEDPQGRLTGGSRRPAAAAGLLTQCR